jgi:AraC family transcriptional regulator of adaptative response/methylated-DNA-[protein]-cysteine methyltransferase
VIIAQLGAGYQSGSGFRDAFAKLLGAPPGSRAARVLFAAWLDTPLGPVTAVGDEAALHLLEYVDRRGLEREIERLGRRTGAAVVPGRTEPIAQIEAELAAYFAGTSLRFRTPLARLGSPFQKLVWDALLAIPPGQTCSYAQLAGAIRRPPGRARRRARQRRQSLRHRHSLPPRDQRRWRAWRLRRRAAAQTLAARARGTMHIAGDGA